MKERERWNEGGKEAGTEYEGEMKRERGKKVSVREGGGVKFM